MGRGHVPVERLFSFELLGADAALVDEEVWEMDALHVVAHVAPRGLHAVANGAHVAPASALPEEFSIKIKTVELRSGL